jgi:hypothetical protein
MTTRLDWDKVHRAERLLNEEPPLRERRKQALVEARTDRYLSSRVHGAFVRPKGKLASAAARLDQVLS